MQGKTYVCPYCFTKHNKRELCFRCVNASCKRRPDFLYAAYECKAPSLKAEAFTKKESRFRRGRNHASCPLCKMESGQLICPSCHNMLPPVSKHHKTLLFSAVGAMDAGKSSYLAVLIHEFKNRTAARLNGAASFLEEASAREYEDRFLQYLYPCIGTDPSIRLPKTKSQFAAANSIGANRPILMEFQRTEGKKGRNKSYTFVFYDQAGEDFEEEDTMFALSGPVGAADGIFFFVDPLKLSYIRNSLKKEQIEGAATTKKEYGSNADAILLRLANVLRARGQLGKEEKIDQPIAIIVPKLDVIAPILYESSPLLRESTHLAKEGFGFQEGFDVQEELRGLLYEWGEQELLAHLSENFSNYQLFSVSSFGNNPDSYGRFGLPRPVRVEDPFLWLLLQNKVIPPV